MSGFPHDSPASARSAQTSARPAAAAATDPATPVEDRLVRRHVLADALGVSERSVTSHVASGVLERDASGLFPLRASIRRYCKHLRGYAPGGGVPGPNLTAERQRVAKGQADALELKNAAARRELLPAAEVEHAWSRICRDLRAGFLALPARLQQRLGHLTAEDVDVIDREVRDVLTGLADDSL